MPSLSVNVRTVDRDFVRWGKAGLSGGQWYNGPEGRVFARAVGQVVHGSFIDRVYIRTRSKITGADVHVAIVAEQLRSFRLYTSALGHLAPVDSNYTNQTSIELGDIAVYQMSGMRVRMRAAGWEATFAHRTVRKPLVGGAEAPADHPSRFFLDTSFRVLDGSEALTTTYGHSSLGYIAPHGIIGQSFDGSKVAVSGRTDTYIEGVGEVNTTAQAEGAIEGSYKDYIIADGPFSTAFKFSRYDAHTPIAPRNVSRLSGIKAPAISSAGGAAGSTELHGVDDPEPAAGGAVGAPSRDKAVLVRLMDELMRQGKMDDMARVAKLYASLP